MIGSNRIRLSPYPNGWGTKTEINGVELQEVVDIQLTCPVDGPPTLRVEQRVGPDLDVTVEGIVLPVLIFDTDYFDLNVETNGNRTRYWVTQRQLNRP